MAKGLRSSVKKANRARLRSQVFGPVENARKERLSAKLLETAGQPSASARDEPMTLDDSVISPIRSDTSSAHFTASSNAKSTETASEGVEMIPSDDALNQITCKPCILPLCNICFKNATLTAPSSSIKLWTQSLRRNLCHLRRNTIRVLGSHAIHAMGKHSLPWSSAFPAKAMLPAFASDEKHEDNAQALDQTAATATLKRGHS
ncbi:MAG: hypothetical protein Q9224_000529 [Gallowayella concinna]